MPVPIAVHADPFHRAIRFATAPPDTENPPAATRLPFGSATTAFTLGVEPPGPVPNADHAEPFHFATPPTATPPAIENAPPAKSSPLVVRSSPRTVPDIPKPRFVQVEPFQRAMLF